MDILDIGTSFIATTKILFCSNKISWDYYLLIMLTQYITEALNKNCTNVMTNFTCYEQLWHLKIAPFLTYEPQNTAFIKIHCI